MPETIQIRESTHEDARPVSKFLQPFIAAEQILPRSVAELTILVKNGFVAESNTAIVGFAAVEIYSKKMAEIQCLAVSVEHRGLGIGKRLIDRCVRCASAHEVCELMAITASENIFRECGFDYSLPNQKRALFMQTQIRSAK